MSAFSNARLQYIQSVPVPATEDIVLTEQLLKEKFNIGWIGENFRKLLLNKTLKGAPARTLAIHELTELSTNQQISDELADKAVTPLSYLLSLLEKQRNGGAGDLITNGYANLTIIEVEGVLWVVRAYWDSLYGYWLVEAGPVSVPCGWRAGRQVVSCDS